MVHQAAVDVYCPEWVAAAAVEEDDDGGLIRLGKSGGAVARCVAAPVAAGQCYGTDNPLGDVDRRRWEGQGVGGGEGGRGRRGMVVVVEGLVYTPFTASIEALLSTKPVHE